MLCTAGGRVVQCTSDIVANLGHHFLTTISNWPLYPAEYNRIDVFCARKSGHYIRMATINVATISGVHCNTWKFLCAGSVFDSLKNCLITFPCCHSHPIDAVIILQ